VKDAQDLIELTRKKYAECKSYSDVGVACTENAPAVRDIRFKTAFERDDRFRFEFRQYHPHLGKSGPDHISVVWSNGTRHTLARAALGQQNYGNLSGPVSGATGISAASVIHIPSLLMPDLFAIRPTWLELEGARILREEILGDSKCLVLTGFRRITEYSVWIDSKEFCIRKIVSTMRTTASGNEEMRQELQKFVDEGKLPANFSIPNFDLNDMVTTYNYSNIEFDQTIPPDVLEPNFPEE
jgi:hypothetical protein